MRRGLASGVFAAIAAVLFLASGAAILAARPAGRQQEDAEELARSIRVLELRTAIERAHLDELGAFLVHDLFDVDPPVPLQTVRRHRQAVRHQAIRELNDIAAGTDPAARDANGLLNVLATDGVGRQRVVQRILDEIHWPQPYYLQATFHHLRSLIGAKPGASAASLIEQAMDRLVQPGADNDFHHWQGRLSQQLSRADADHALAMLNLAARDPSGARPESLLAALEERMGEATTEEARRTFIRLRDILQRDAYWWPDESSGARRYRFRLEPLRRWWLRRDTL